jgi:hypothetical protein
MGASQTKVSGTGEDADTELSRRLQPKSDADFGTLQSELQQWRDREQDNILAAHPAVQISLEQEALAKEGYLLRRIDSLRTDEHRDRRTRRIDGELAEMAKPEFWTLTSGDRIQIETPDTAHASNLRRIYNGLAEKEGDSRKKNLLEARIAVRENLETTDSISMDLVELIDRELDLLRRGIDRKVLHSLNNRVRNLFLQFVQNGRHNPAAASVYGPESFVEPIVKISQLQETWNK